MGGWGAISAMCFFRGRLCLSRPRLVVVTLIPLSWHSTWQLAVTLAEAMNRKNSKLEMELERKNSKLEMERRNSKATQEQERRDSQVFRLSSIK